MPPRPLPAQTTSFVGRTEELALLGQSFAGGARLVTLLGPPGIGKSRLALQFAERAPREGAFPGGVYVCDLVEAVSAEDLYAALSRALDAVVGSARAGDRVLELGVALGRLGDALVVLDNVERLAGFGPETIGRWLRDAARVRFLATSRVRLRLAGEVVHELGPLSLPQDAGDPARSQAVQLFVERARTVRPSFALTAENAASVADLVRQLDGIPLALELGASRMGVLSPARLLALLPRRLDVLSAGIRDPAARQGTLREAIDASWGLLEPWEQAALAQLSVFRGGFGLDAAEAVVRAGVAGASAGAAPPLLDVLASLTDKSWLFTSASPAHPDEVRFGLYLSIRDYAAERLEALGGAADAAARHAAHFLEIARAALEADPADAAAAPRVGLDRDNLLAAHRSLLAAPRAPDGEGAIRIALALEGMLTRWGPVSTLVAMLDEALGAGAEIAAPLRRRALVTRARAAQRLGRLDESRAGYEGALALARRAEDRRMEGVASAGLGEVLREQGRLQEAERRLLEGLALLAESGERRAEARAHNALGHAYTVTGRPSDARARFEQALRLVQGAGDHDVQATARISLGLVAVAEGRLDEGGAYLEEVSAGPEPLPPQQEGACLNAIAFLRQEQGRLPEAIACAEAALVIGKKLGNRRFEGFFLGQAALCHAELGELAQARAGLERAAALVREAGDARADALFTAALAALRARLGQVEEAARLLAWSDEQLAAVGDPMLHAAIDLYRAEVTLARASRSGEDPAEAAAAAERCVAAALGVDVAGVAGLPGQAGLAARPGSPAARSHHVRIALRVVQPGLASALAGAPPTSPASAPAERAGPHRGGALVVSPDGRWCRLPDGREVMFQRARALRLMMLRLVEERVRAPGHALSIAALFESGWPGERASPEAAHNRVYVGVSRLRKLGFQGLLLSRDDGFLLDPAVGTYRAERSV